MVQIYWAGDSTVKQNNITTYPQTGIGQVLYLFLKEGAIVKNHAENGRSTKSFINEGRLTVIEEVITAGDYLFIQFGHNDEKVEDPDRGTEAFGDYQENLLKMVDVARAKGATPLLITPAYRRSFDSQGNVKPNNHLDYPEAMMQLAAAQGVTCIDLCGLSEAALQAVGPEFAKRWYMYFDAGIYDHYPDGSQDNTHFRYEGAVKMASLLVGGLKEVPLFENLFL